jgi:RimJ/RimL family protein N-acetyltransferase
MFATRHVMIRTLQAHEAERVLDDVFEGMSLESRRLRFHTPMPRLPAMARKQLSQVDGDRHLAIVAWAGGHAIGLGRMVWVGCGEAEIAVEVADAWQGRGIGADLLRELAQRARDLGYERLIAEILPENTAMLRMVGRVFPGARRHLEDGVVHVVCPIIDVIPEVASISVPSPRPELVAS